MGNRRPADPAGEAGRATARSGSAGGGEWPTLCPGKWLHMALPAEGLSAPQHGPRLSTIVGLGRHAGTPPPRTLYSNTRTRRPRSEPDRCDHRQSIHPISRKRGAKPHPVGYDAGKKVKGVKYHILVDTFGLFLGLLLNIVVQQAGIQG